MAVNIVEEIAARMDAARTAVVADGRRVSFGELFSMADAVAAWLRASPGFATHEVPRVGLACGNGIDYIVLALGILKAGACFVPVAEELTEEERAEIVDRTALHGLVLGPGERWRRGEACGAAGPVEESAWVRLDAVSWGHEDAFTALQPAFIRFSSGTTGRSKGVVLGHRTLLDRIAAANEVLEIGPGDRVLWMLPMAHHFAVSIVLYLYFGACTVVGRSHVAAEVLDLAERERATVIYGAPFHHALLAADAGGYRWPDLRLAVSTAAPLTTATARAFHQRFGKPLVQGMGIIEVGLPLLNTADAEEAPDAVGRPLPSFGVDLRGDDGSSLAEGTGELWLKGPGMFDAYLSPWQPRAEVCRNGWFATGDLAERDAAGRVFLRGRKKSVLNVGGMKVFPEEVEAVLDRHPGVVRSRVTGLQHALFGTVPVAEIVPRDGEAPATAELKAWCRRSLSAHKVPVSFRHVESLPLTASGKIRRL